MNLGLVKVAVTIGSAVAIGTIAGPLITITSPFWGLMGTHMSVNMLSLAGVSTVTGLGMSLGNRSGAALDAAIEKALIEAEITLQKRKLANLQEHLEGMDPMQQTT